MCLWLVPEKFVSFFFNSIHFQVFRSAQPFILRLNHLGKNHFEKCVETCQTLISPRNWYLISKKLLLFYRKHQTNIFVHFCATTVLDPSCNTALSSLIHIEQPAVPTSY